MAREDSHFRLRIPDALKAQIEKSAAENNRSMTAEIISRLEESYSIVPIWKETIENVRELWSKVDKLELEVYEHDLELKNLRLTRR